MQSPRSTRTCRRSATRPRPSRPATGEARRQRLRTGHRRAADRRCEQPRDRAARRRARTRSSGGFACTRSASGRRTPRGRSCTRDQLGGDVFDSGGFGGGGFGRRRRFGGGAVGGFVGGRRADAEGGRRRRPAARTTAQRTPTSCQGVRRPPEGGRDAGERTEITWIFAAFGALSPPPRSRRRCAGARTP